MERFLRQIGSRGSKLGSCKGSKDGILFNVAIISWDYPIIVDEELDNSYNNSNNNNNTVISMEVWAHVISMEVWTQSNPQKCHG